MMMLPVVLSLCLGLGIWAAKPPKPCVSPPLLEGSISMSTEGGTLLTGRFTYDALGHQLRVRHFGIVNNKPSAKDLLMIFHEGVLYDINYATKTCKKKKLDSEFSPLQVPENAHHMGQVVLGSSSLSGMGILVNTWMGYVPQTNGSYTSVFTEFGCVPVSTLYYTPRTQTTLISFFNILLGIMNPMDFIPPPFCHQTMLETADGTQSNFFDAMMSMAKEVVA